jgi:protein-arginine kinase activator protein McsA
LANNNEKNIPLEEKLKMAIETENYEEAAKIRDEIKKTKKNEKN